MPTYSYYADYILTLTKNVCKSSKKLSESSDGCDSSTAVKDRNTLSDEKKIIIVAKKTDDVRTYHSSQ